MKSTATMLAAAAAALLAAPASADDACNCEGAEVTTSRIQSGPTPFDIDAREQQVASGDLRIPPLKPEEFSEEARELTRSMQAFFGAKGGDVPVAFATTFRHPGLSMGQMKLGLELNQNGKLPPRERELVILRVAWLVRSPFEWGEHVTYGKNLGLTSAEIERITQGSDAVGWNEHDRAVLRGVEELLGDHAISDETWATLSKTWDEAQLIELPGLVGSYAMTAMLYNTLRFEMMEGNEGFRQR